MSSAVISAEGVGKRYTKFTDHPTLIGSLAKIRGRSRRDFLWAVRGAGFSVSEGECVGLIGANGSGKSTLLQMIAGITAPTEGSVAVRGRVAPLVSVGVGFHPELTGRENIYVNGCILGATRAEMEARVDDIIAFSELQEFIDTPVKFYSSGMYVRLGFSVAIHAQPDILLVDEVLAVGDVAFQTKCTDRMDEIRALGATLLVVSHNMSAIRRLCARSIVLHGGRLVHDGDTETAIGLYHELAAGQYREAVHTDGGVDNLILENEAGEPSRRLTSGETLKVRARVRVDRAVRAPVVTLQLRSEQGFRVSLVRTEYGEIASLDAGGTLDVDVDVPLKLPTGTYSVGVVLRDEELRRVAMSELESFFVDGRETVAGVADLGVRIRVGAADRAVSATSPAAPS